MTAPLQTKALRWLPWVLLALTPLLFLPDATDPQSGLRRGLMGVLCAVLWIVRRRQWGAILALPGRGLAIAAAAFTVGGLLGIATALHPWEAAADVALWTMLLGLAVALGWELRTFEATRREMWRAGTVAALVLGCIRALQAAKVDIDMLTWAEPEAATLGNPNFFCGAMALLSVMGIWTFVEEKGSWRWPGLAAALVSIGWSLVGTTMGAVIALAVMAAVLAEGWVVLRSPDGFYARSKVLRAVAAGLPVAAALGIMAWKMSQPVAFADILEDSAQERLMLWRKSAQMLAEHPLTGVGAGHWHYHILRLGVVSQYQGFATRYFMEAHNDYWHVLAERGIVGGAGFIALFVLLWRVGWANVAKGRAVLFPLAGLSGWMAFAMTNLPAHQGYLAALLVAFAAALLGGLALEPAGGPARAWLARLVGGVVVAATAASLVHQGCVVAADRANFELLAAKGRQNWPQVDRIARAAARWYNPHDRVTATPISWYSGVALLSQGDARGALPFLLDAKAWHPWHPQVSSNLGVALYMTGDTTRAFAEMEDLLARFPAFGDARINLCEMYLTQGRLADAQRTVAPWAQPTGNPQYDGYHAKVKAVLEGK